MICNAFQHNIKSSGVLNQYIYFVSEINKSTNNVQSVHTIYMQAEPIPYLLKAEIRKLKNQFNLQILLTALSLYYNCCIHWKVIKLTAIHTAVKSLSLGH